MLAAANRLKAIHFQEGITEEKNALAYLIKARDDVKRMLKDSRSERSERSFSRAELQKLRRPKKDKQDEASELAARLRRLADQEDAVLRGDSGSGRRWPCGGSATTNGWAASRRRPRKARNKVRGRGNAGERRQCSKAPRPMTIAALPARPKWWVRAGRDDGP